MGLTPNGSTSFNSATRFEQMGVNTNLIAGEGLINTNAQENSIVRASTINGGSEAMVAAFGSFSQNSAMDDVNIVNPTAGSQVLG
jgi:hypothetical protein